MPELPRYLLVRPEDLVVLGVTWTGCLVDGTTLLATGLEPPTLFVTFPPQAVAESKERGAGGVLRGRLSGTGTVALTLELGTAIPLTVEGLLNAVAAARVAGGAVEIPFGLTLDLARIAADAHAHHDGALRTSPDGGHALWQTRVVSSGPMTYAAALAGGDDSGVPDVQPLDAGDRGQIAAAGPGRLDRLALSPLGGTLSAHLTNDTFAWDHDMALGRDRRVRVLRRGVLYPYGHRATFEMVAERTVENGVAALRVTSVLAVTEPVRAMPGDGSRAARTFPFHEVELLTTRVEGVLPAEPDWTNVQPPSEFTQGLRNELAAAQAVTATAQETFNAWTPVLSIDDLVNRGDQQAADLRDRLWPAMTRLEEEIAAASAPGPEPEPPPPDPATDPVFLGPDELAGTIQPPATFTPPPAADVGSFAVIEALKGQLRQLQDEAAPIEAHVNAEIERGNALNALGRDENALAGAGVGEAQALLAARAEEARINGLIAEKERSIHLLFVPRRDGAAVPFRVRCAGVLDDVTFETPVVFVSDFTLPPDDFFAGYHSLADDTLPTKVAEALGAPLNAALPGARVDVVRSATPTTADVQQVHALRLAPRQSGADVRPVVEELTVELPELRALLPDLPARVPLRYSEAFGDGDATDTALSFVQKVPVTFDGRAERGGGLLTPSFDADAISRTFGPVDRRAVEGASAEAFAKMKLLGVELAALLPDGTPPEIVQLLPPGGPAGVRMSWTGRRLNSKGPFRAHRPDDELDTTTLDLVVEQSAESRSTRCALTAFTLSLPGPGTELLAVGFDSLVFTQSDGHAPKVEVTSPQIRFSGALTLLQGLRDAIDLPGTLPALRSVPDGVTVSYALHVPDAPAGAFLLRNVAVSAAVDVPFRGGQPSIALAFASKADPFHLQVSLFGGGGYIDVLLDAGGVRRFEASLDFGAVIELNFGIVSAEVHALGGVRFGIAGDDVDVTAFLRIGGSVELFGLVTVSVELVVELRFESAPRPRLVGRATLVIEVDLTLYADSVELDSGEWEFLGGSGPAQPLPPPEEQRADWERRQEAYA